jgi:hypothetical protein
VKVERSIGWRRFSDDFGGCTQSQLGLRSYGGQVPEYITGIPGTFPSYYSLTNLEDHPSVDPYSQWCFGRETFAVDLHGVTSFTHIGASCCTISFLSDSYSIGKGSYRYLGQAECKIFVSLFRCFGCFGCFERNNETAKQLFWFFKRNSETAKQ